MLECILLRVLVGAYKDSDNPRHPPQKKLGLWANLSSGERKGLEIQPNSLSPFNESTIWACRDSDAETCLSLLLLNSLMDTEGAAPGLHKEKSQSQLTDFSTSLFIWPVLICILYNKTLIINITLFQVLCFIIDHCQTQVIPGSLIRVVSQECRWP